MKVHYSSNNSGGAWWLEDKDWRNLEAAGWEVEWYKNRESSYGKYKDGRFLGALASNASKDFASIEEAEDEFRRITGEDPEEVGCECCGRPHNFYSYDR